MEELCIKLLGTGWLKIAHQCAKNIIAQFFIVNQWFSTEKLRIWMPCVQFLCAILSELGFS